VLSIGAAFLFKWNAAALADEAVAIAARFVVPGVTMISPQVDACLVSGNVVWLIVEWTGAGCLVPVCVLHTRVRINLSVHRCHFPYKVGLSSGALPLPCCPYVDSVVRTSSAVRPFVICKQSTNTNITNILIIIN